MVIDFKKYQGTGNDFVMINDLNLAIPDFSQSLIEKLCHRKFGIGADGLIILKHSEKWDFKMIYYNSDGHESSMCGNGGRCIVRFAADLGFLKDEYTFEAIDGLHKARMDDKEVHLQMKDVGEIRELEDGALFLDTGSPHYVRFMNELPGNDFVDQARAIRYNESFKRRGVNVNFAKLQKGRIVMRTYERGVEDETLSCGTGVTAVSLAAGFKNLVHDEITEVETAGGSLKVAFEKAGNGFKNIWLQGPAEKVFEGKIEV